MTEPLPVYEGADLALPRAKPRRPLFAVGYRLVMALARVAGSRRLLGPALDVAWAAQRVAFELAGRTFGPAFQDRALGVTADAVVAAASKADRVLDVGCGTGRMLVTLAPHVAEVVGVDHSEAHLAEARRSTAAQPNVTLVQDDAARYVEGLEDDAFDLVLLVHVVEHLEDPVPFLRRLARIATRAVVEVPDTEADPLNLARLAVGRMVYADDDHVRELTESTLRSLLADGGWTVSDVWRRGGSLAALASRQRA